MRKHLALDPVRVQVEKAVRALEFVTHRLGRSLFASEEMRAKWMHDLKVIRRLNNLKSTAAEYTGADQTVLFEHEIGFSPKDHAKGLSNDSAGGVELPVFPPAIIREHRVVMTEHDAALARQEEIEATLAELDSRERHLACFAVLTLVARIPCFWYVSGSRLGGPETLGNAQATFSCGQRQ